MSKGTLRANSLASTHRKHKVWQTILFTLLHCCNCQVYVPSHLLQGAYMKYLRYRRNLVQFKLHRALISTTSFEDVFMNMNDHACLSHFCFLKSHVKEITHVLCSKAGFYSTMRNRYSSTPLLAACLMLSRLATPYRWADREAFFRKHSSQLSEIFWEALDDFLDDRESLKTSPLNAEYIAERADRHAICIREKTQGLGNCIGFIDGTNIEIARPSDSQLQQVVYNGHKRMHCLKYQAIVSADGIILHCYGPVEGRRHDWTFYSRSEMDQQLEECMAVGDVQYCTFRDSGYNWRQYLEVPFSGSSLSADQTAFNSGLAGGRVTVEWLFKEMKLYWTAIDFQRKMKVLQAPAGSLYLAAMILMNIRTCFYSNQVTKFFACAPPSVEVRGVSKL